MTTILPRQRRRLTRPAVLVLIVVALSVGLLGSWGWKTHVPAVEFPGGFGYGIGSAPTRPALVMGIRGCIAGEGAASIVAVKAVDATGGMRVTAFAINTPDTNGVGTADKPVSELAGFDEKHITAKCGEHSQSVAVQMVADTYPAKARSLEVDYKVHGITRMTSIEGNLTLFKGPLPTDGCEDEDLSTSAQADCDADTTS